MKTNSRNGAKLAKSSQQETFAPLRLCVILFLVSSFVVTFGCSPPPASTEIAPAENRPEPAAETDPLEEPTADPAETAAADAAQPAGDSNATEDSDEAETTKFIGQDGRERVVPTGPPPTDRDGRLELTFDDLSFEMEKGGDFDRSMLTDRIKNFHGADVRLRGFIRPSFRQSKIEKFVFVRDDKECCFGPGAAIYDNALVSLKQGTETDYTVRPIVVAGKLYLKEYETPDGMVLSIYRIKNGKIE